MTAPARCDYCRQPVDQSDVNVEVFELTGALLCPLCADKALSVDHLGEDAK